MEENNNQGYCVAHDKLDEYWEKTVFCPKCQIQTTEYSKAICDGDMDKAAEIYIEMFNLL